MSSRWCVVDLGSIKLFHQGSFCYCSPPLPQIFRPSAVSVTILQDSSEGAWSRVQRAQLTRNKRNCSLDWSHWIEFFKHFKIGVIILFNSVGNSSDIIFNWNIIEIINREIERYYSCGCVKSTVIERRQHQLGRMADFPPPVTFSVFDL